MNTAMKDISTTKIYHESEDVVLTRIIQGYSADISELANLPQARDDLDILTSEVDIEVDFDIEERTFLTPVPEIVTAKKQYDSFDNAFEGLKSYTDSLCINAVITSSIWEKREGEEKTRNYGVIQCHKSGKPSKGNYAIKGTPGSRNGYSARCECPFKWTINKKQYKNHDGKNVSNFFIKAVNNEHNHVPDKKAFEALSNQRRLTEDQKQYVQELMEFGTTPSEMVTALSKRYPSQTFVNNTIYQARLEIRKRILNNRTPVQHFVDKLSESSCYRFDMDVDNQGKLTRLFFAHEASIELFNRFSTVLVMDCTYKTNRFGMLCWKLVE